MSSIFEGLELNPELQAHIRRGANQHRPQDRTPIPLRPNMSQLPTTLHIRPVCLAPIKPLRLEQ